MAPFGKEAVLRHQKNEARSQQVVYTSVEDIKSCFRHAKQDAVYDGLTPLRNQLAIKYEESAIAPHDSRLLLVQHWMENDHGARILFDVWEVLDQRQASTLSVIVSIVSSLLTLLTAHYTHHHLGYDVLKALLSTNWTRKLNSYLAGSHAELTLVTLKLFNVMGSFASGKERRPVMEAFAWEAKCLPRLLNMRRKSKDNIDILKRPDIRTLYILFIISFIDADVESQVKSSFLEQHSAAFLSIFKGLSGDSYSVIKKILESSWAGIWSDSKIKRTSKILLFSENTLLSIIKLYERNEEEDEEVPADLVHHFLLAICTRPGVGICFKDQGWYPRDDASGNKKIYNKILANIVKSLQVNESSRQQELALRILAACPELVASYWTAAALTLEPRLSSKWLANNAVFSSIISLPIPSQSFFLPDSTLYKPSPPPLSSLTENIVPAVGMKVHFTKGLQFAHSPLVQHCTAIALAKCLMKFKNVLDHLRMVCLTLEESEEDGQWSTRRGELERAIRQRVPDFQVIVAFAQQSALGEGSSSLDTATRTSLLTEAAHRLLWLYHQCLPLAVAEARFDVGKLLQSFIVPPAYKINGLSAVKQLHVLRLLKESDQFIWSNKTGPSGHSYIYILLKTYASTIIPSTRSTLKIVLQHILAQSILFEQDREEPSLWLGSIPTSARSDTAEAPDSTRLTDEQESVIRFLDDCVSRCLKTPYRYIEDLSALVQPNSIKNSPLLMTVLEQLNAKVTNRLLSASDVLALAYFIRCLLYALSAEQESLSVLHTIGAKVDEILHPTKLFKDHPVMTAAIRREVDMMHVRLSYGVAQTLLPSQSAPLVLAFLQQVEETPIPSLDEERKVFAYELVDWLRLVNLPLTWEDIRCIWDKVELAYPPALKNLVDALNPSAQHPELVSLCQSIASSIGFHQLLLYSDSGDVLAETLRESDLTPVNIRRAFIAISHRFFQLQSSENDLQRGLDVATSLCKKVKNGCLPDDVYSVKLFAFSRWDGLRRLLLSTSSTIASDVEKFLASILEKTDQALVSEYTSFWSSQLSQATPPNMAKIWIPYFSCDQILAAIDSTINLSMLESILHEIRLNPSSYQRGLHTKMGKLLALRAQLPFSAVVEDVLSAAIGTALPLGVCPMDSISLKRNSLPEMVSLAQIRWVQIRESMFVNTNVEDFLICATWSDATVRIITTLILHAPKVPSRWIQLANLDKRSVQHMVWFLLAVFNAVQLSSQAELDLEPLELAIARLVDGTAQEELSSTRADCASCILSLKGRPFVQKTILKKVGQISPDALTIEILSLATMVESNGFIDLGLQWAARNLSSGSPQPMEDKMVDQLCNLLGHAEPQPHIVEATLSVIIQQCLSNPAALRLAVAVSKKSQSKPLVVNRYIQSIIQHPEFPKFAAISSASREGVCSLLYTFFHMHPWNTCQPSHVQGLASIYNGTLSISDRQILSIFKLFEVNRKASIASLLEHWGSTTNALEALQRVDSIKMLRSCLSYPKWRKLDVGDQSENKEKDKELYDPVFFMLLFSVMLNNTIPESAFAWIELFRTNVVGFLIRSLSAKDHRIRELALLQIMGIWACLEDADLQEKPQVRYILGLLKNTFPPESISVRRLPSYTTLLLMHALRGVFYPSNFVHPLTSRFLLQRPELDINDVPLLYGMLYSSDGESWRKDRSWIVKFLADGMMTSEDWHVLKRRHTWDILASLFQSSEGDQSIRRGILEVLLKLTQNARAATSLVFKSALLPWIEMQLLAQVAAEEAVVWVQILENILQQVQVGLTDMETINRCLLVLISDDQAIHAVFPSLTKILPLLSCSTTLMKKAVDCLAFLEAEVSFTIWSTSVRTFWRLSMDLDIQEVWDAMTPRLIALWSIDKDVAGNEGEWARREVLRNIRM